MGDISGLTDVAGDTSNVCAYTLAVKAHGSTSFWVRVVVNWPSRQHVLVVGEVVCGCGVVGRVWHLNLLTADAECIQCG